jgi:hypothetical protein
LTHVSTALCSLDLLCEVHPSQSFRHSTLGRTPLDEGSARHRDFYIATFNVYNRQRAGFEPTTTANERPQTHDLECAPTEVGQIYG